MRDLVVCMSTIRQRDRVRIPTVEQLRSLDLPVDVMTVQDPSLPLTAASRVKTGVRMLSDAIDTGVHWILQCEDDIDLDPEIIDWIRYSMEHPGPPTWMLYRPRFRPPGDWDGLRRVRDRTGLWGSQCILLTRDQADIVRQNVTDDGFDLAFRAVGGRVPPRPVAQHREGVRRVHRSESAIRWLRAPDYTGPNSHTLLRSLWEWLPGRRAKGRCTQESVISANLGVDMRTVAWLLSSMEQAGAALRDQSGWHRGLHPDEAFADTLETDRVEGSTLW